MDEILHPGDRLPEPEPTCHAGETAVRPEEAGSAGGARLRRFCARSADALVSAGRRVSSLFHRADAAAAGRKATGPIAFLLAAGIIGAGLVVATVYTPGYVVTVDGRTLGTVKDPSVFENVVERVEDRASGILGREYTLDSTVTYDFALTEKDKLSNVGEFETYLFDQIGEVMKSYVLKVNGTFIGAAADETQLTAMLDAIKAPYVNENTTSAEFVESVSLTRQYTPSDVQQDLASMEQILTSNNSGQTTYEVRAGDTFMQIAYDNGMGMDELIALNPGVDINKIYIGELLNVKEVVPYLSVRTTETVTYQEAIPAPVQEVEDATMYQGDSKVLQSGAAGTAQVTANLTLVNGHERERTVTDTVTLAEPTVKVVAVGTKVRPSWLPTGRFIWPTSGSISSYFGYRYIFGSYSYHSGIDISGSYGAGIKASDGGTVIWAGTGTGSNWSYGKYVVIDHGNGYQTYYAHCSSLLVSAGDKVYQGQVIAKVGSTGRSTGNHCHFQVKINGTTVNPLSYLP